MAAHDSTRRDHDFKDFTGLTFGRLTVICFIEFIERAYPSRSRRISTWLCRCECGHEIIARSGYLKRNRIGCMLCKSKTHGMADSHEYGIWKSMIQRCHNPNTAAYPDYGGRGIAVCERWRTSFDAFYEDIGSRPSRKHSLDRFPNNNGNYEPGNCRWATKTEQQRNMRNNIMLTLNGETRCLSEWSKLVGIHRSTLCYRILRGWTDERVLNTPTRR